MNTVRREPLSRASMKGLTMLSVAMCLSMAAQAADPKPAQGTQAHFESLDRNNDRELSKVEAKADPSLFARFAKFDVNLNGFITRNEYDAMSQRAVSMKSGSLHGASTIELVERFGRSSAAAAFATLAH